MLRMTEADTSYETSISAASFACALNFRHEVHIILCRPGTAPDPLNRQAASCAAFGTALPALPGRRSISRYSGRAAFMTRSTAGRSSALFLKR